MLLLAQAIVTIHSNFALLQGTRWQCWLVIEPHLLHRQYSSRGCHCQRRPPYLVDGGLERRHGLEGRELDHEGGRDDDDVLHDARRRRHVVHPLKKGRHFSHSDSNSSDARHSRDSGAESSPFAVSRR